MTVVLRCLNCGFSFTVTYPSVQSPLIRAARWSAATAGQPTVVADLLARAHIAAFSELRLLLRLLIAAVLAGVLGWERESAHKPAGLRTHMVVGISSRPLYRAGGVGASGPSRCCGGWRTG